MHIYFHTKYSNLLKEQKFQAMLIYVKLCKERNLTLWNPWAGPASSITSNGSADTNPILYGCEFTMTCEYTNPAFAARYTDHMLSRIKIGTVRTY